MVKLKSYFSDLVSSKQKKLNQLACQKIVSKFYKIADQDDEKNTILIDMGDDIHTLLTMSEKLALDSSVVFDASLINLKTLSTVSNFGMMFAVSVSGVLPNGNKKIKLLFCKEAGSTKYLLRSLVEMKRCIALVSKYLNQRADQHRTSNLDLSMFEHVDPYSFNPLSLGEKKDFIYRTWKDYIVDVSVSPSTNIELSSLVSELQACSEFEEKNKMLLSEVGEYVLDELLWNKAMSESAHEWKEIN